MSSKLVVMTLSEYIAKCLEAFNKGVELGKGIGRGEICRSK
jgi:hypothetical protein